ncbi:MAG: GNAT family N-acetyltransferase [Bacteroidales bacterium]|nr:GNAT family N-acetyltransferase [Bacteroidales bacterium]
MMREYDYIKLDQPEDPDWIVVGELFTRMYSRMDEIGLLLPLSADGTEKWLKTVRNTSGKYGLVILVKDWGKAVGFAHGMVKFLPDYLGGFAVGSITHVYVDDDSRRSGIGKVLVNLLEDWFLTKKVHSIELQVITGNPLAKEFWKKLGYLEELQQYRKTWD